MFRVDDYFANGQEANVPGVKEVKILKDNPVGTLPVNWNALVCYDEDDKEIARFRLDQVNGYRAYPSST